VTDAPSRHLDAHDRSGAGSRLHPPATRPPAPCSRARRDTIRGTGRRRCRRRARWNGRDRALGGRAGASYLPPSTPTRPRRTPIIQSPFRAVIDVTDVTKTAPMSRAPASDTSFVPTSGHVRAAERASMQDQLVIMSATGSNTKKARDCPGCASGPRPGGRRSRRSTASSFGSGRATSGSSLSCNRRTRGSP